MFTLSCKKVKQVFYKAMQSNSSPSKLALSFCVGLYIAFSPIPGGHTVLMLASQWLFSLNFPVLFLSTSISNPWTMIPFFAFEYAFGLWFVHSFLGLNPSWVISLEKIFGYGNICVWSFFIGGNVLGIVTAIVCYPIFLSFFKYMSIKKSNKIHLAACKQELS